MLRDIKSCEVIDIFLNIIYSFLTLKQINVNTTIIHCFYLNEPHAPYVLLDQPQEKQDDYYKCLKKFKKAIILTDTLDHFSPPHKSHHFCSNLLDTLKRSNPKPTVNYTYYQEEGRHITINQNIKSNHGE